MDIQLDDKQLKAVLAEAIFGQLTQEKKDEVIRTAVKTLFEKGNGYNTKSIFDRAIEDALRSISRDLVLEMFQDKVYRKKFEAVVKDAFHKAFEGKSREKLIERFASSLATVFQGRWD